ncbi:MAG: hypothetical protein AB7T06_11615 [Kofleriaceae bacterium]
MRRDPRRGDAPLYLLCTLLLSCATGVGVYLYLKDHYAAKVAEAAPPKPRLRDRPVEAVPAATPVVEPPAPVPIVPEPVADPAPPPEDPDEPDELTAEEVEATITAARQRFSDCAVTGRVTLTLRIRPSGRVELVTVDGAESDETSACLVRAAKRIRFAKSTKGLTARYSLVGE